MLIEIVKDRALCDVIRKEVARARTSTGEIDTRTLISLPVLQSVYTEILRMHVSFLITRTATENVVIDGWTVPQGSTIQAPTEVAHFDENICKLKIRFGAPIKRVLAQRGNGAL